MENNICRNPLAPAAIKRTFWINLRKPLFFAHGSPPLYPLHRDNAAEVAPEMHPWRGLFDDPALHDALDRILASNRIS